MRQDRGADAKRQDFRPALPRLLPALSTRRTRRTRWNPALNFDSRSARFDRMVNLVTGRMRSPHRAGQLATRPRRDPSVGASGAKRSRAREILANGAAAGQRAASPVAALAAVRAESN